MGQAADRHASAACCMQHGLRKEASGDNRAEPFFYASSIFLQSYMVFLGKWDALKMRLIFVYVVS